MRLVVHMYGLFVFNYATVNMNVDLQKFSFCLGGDAGLSRRGGGCNGCECTPSLEVETIYFSACRMRNRNPL